MGALGAYTRGLQDANRNKPSEALWNQSRLELATTLKHGRLIVATCDEDSLSADSEFLCQAYSPEESIFYDPELHGASKSHAPAKPGVESDQDR